MSHIGRETYFDADADNTVTNVSAGEAALYGIECSNPNTTDIYIQLFDLDAASVTLGTTTPKLSFLVPKGNGTDSGGMDKLFGDDGVGFRTKISVAVTTTATGNTDPTSGGVLNLIYE